MSPSVARDSDVIEWKQSTGPTDQSLLSRLPEHLSASLFSNTTPVSFPKITSVRIRAVQQNQRMIQRDARGPDSDWSACRQPVQVAAPT